MSVMELGFRKPAEKTYGFEAGGTWHLHGLARFDKNLYHFWMQRLNHRIHADEVASTWSYLIYIGKIIISCPKNNLS